MDRVCIFKSVSYCFRIYNNEACLHRKSITIPWNLAFSLTSLTRNQAHHLLQYEHWKPIKYMKNSSMKKLLKISQVSLFHFNIDSMLVRFISDRNLYVQFSKCHFPWIFSGAGLPWGRRGGGAPHLVVSSTTLKKSA